MEKIIFKTIVRLRRLAFFRVTYRTLMMLMPLAVVGSIFQFLWQSVFSPTSLISNIFYFDKWLPDQIFNASWYACQGVTSVIFGTFGLFTAYFSAQYTARLYQKDAQMAGVSGMLALLLCAYRFRDIRNFQLSFNWRFFNINSFLFALLIGFGTGLIFRFLGTDYHHRHAESAQVIKQKAFNSFRPMLATWLIGLVIGILALFKQIQVGSLPKLDPKTAQEGAKRLGAKVFLPSIVLALTSILIAQFTPLGGQVGIGIGAVVSLILAIILTKAPTKQVFKDSQRMVRSVGAPGVLPQLLAMLGVVFTTCGVGKLTANMISHVFPAGNHFLGVALYCIAMALFTYIMGNAFAAFAVITAAIGIPFVIAQGANPVVVAAIGMTSGYCGTLVTPMAANFNTLPVALLEMKDQMGVIKQQAPVAVILLIIQIGLMYFLAF